MSLLPALAKLAPSRRHAIWLLAALAIAVGCLSTRTQRTAAQTPPAAGAAPLTALAPLAPHTTSVTGSSLQTAASATHRHVAPFLKRPPSAQAAQTQASPSVKASRDAATATLTAPTGSAAHAATNAPLVLAGNTNFDGMDACG